MIQDDLIITPSDMIFAGGKKSGLRGSSPSLPLTSRHFPSLRLFEAAATNQPPRKQTYLSYKSQGKNVHCGGASDARCDEGGVEANVLLVRRAKGKKVCLTESVRPRARIRQLHLLFKCQVAEGEPGRILIGGFVVGEEHLNRHGKFHGGVSATLVDAVSSLSAVSPECPQVAWVSADLNIS